MQQVWLASWVGNLCADVLSQVDDVGVVRRCGLVCRLLAGCAVGIHNNDVHPGFVEQCEGLVHTLSVRAQQRGCAKHITMVYAHAWDVVGTEFENCT